MILNGSLTELVMKTMLGELRDQIAYPASYKMVDRRRVMTKRSKLGRFIVAA